MSEEPGGISRRTVLTTGTAAILGVGVGGAAATLLQSRSPALWSQPDRSGAAPVNGGAPAYPGPGYHGAQPTYGAQPGYSPPSGGPPVHGAAPSYGGNGGSYVPPNSGGGHGSAPSYGGNPGSAPSSSNGHGSAPGRFRRITDLWLDGNVLYVADSLNGRIQMLSLTSEVSPPAGTP